MELEKLKAPFIPKWRVQSIKNSKAFCVPYVDARQVQERFDEVCGPEKWQNTYDPETGAASIAIMIGNDWIWKTDVGTDSNVEKEKGRASDAFKRAAVLWGVGRDLYQKGTKVLDAEGKNPKTAKGQVLYTGDQITNYINGLSESKALLMQIWKLNSELQSNETFKTSMSNLKELL